MKLPFGLGEVFKRTIYGTQDTPYKSEWTWRRKEQGDRRLHCFHRGDEDPDPHDHPWEFWTFPLRGYWEHVIKPVGSMPMMFQGEYHYVAPFRWHHRPAEYRHRVLTRADKKKIWTIIKTGPVTRTWGFWRAGGSFGHLRQRLWVYWKDYLKEKGVKTFV